MTVLPRRHAFAAAALLTLLLGCGAHAMAQNLEYQVKAAFLLNFARFTEFPPSTFESETAPVSICVLGENPFGETLVQTLANERAGNRPLRARTILNPLEARGCHIVFVPHSQTPQTSSVVAATADRGVVTVGESRTFLADGGTINLFVEDGRVRFSMRPQAVERRGVRFSSHLLRLARTPERPEVPK